MIYRNRYIASLTLLLTALLAGGNALAEGVVVHGSVFGGGNKADVQTNTEVNISTGQVEGNVYGGGNLGDVGTIVKNTTDYNYTWTGNDASNNTIVSGKCTVNISGGTIGLDGDNAVNDEDHGNVFGGGKGDSTTFWCEKAMAYETSVTISAGTVKRNVYGGGRIGRVENNTEVTIGTGAGSNEGDDAPIIGNDVFGAGAGVVTHGYSALVRGNSTVTVQGNAKVVNSVYGGGEIATVGKYNIARTTEEATTHGVKIGMPYETVSGGISTVNILGHAKIGPDASGHVFGAGKGVDPTNDGYTYEGSQKSTRPKRTTLKPESLDGYIYDLTDDNRVIREYFNNQAAYYDFLETLALVSETHVTIKGNSTVKGSVYGGSESGFVQRNTDVKIQESCTINTTGSGQDINNGNVFGGGRGVRVFAEAGKVKGNTLVTISGGTMHGNVYGGGELGDVGKINKADINNYIWSGYTTETTDDDTGICEVLVTDASATIMGNVFGAGKGDSITFECEKAMAYKTVVSISAGSVNGNVYGGGEIGRVENNTKVTIGAENQTGSGNAPIIDGSVFGAGKGKETHGYSALVRNNSEVTVQGIAWVKHNVYGGGEIATVGRYWVKPGGENAQPAEGQPAWPADLPAGMPYANRSGGDCTVTIQDNAVVGPNGEATETAGHVFGAGKGVQPNFSSGVSKRMNNNGVYEPFNALDKYLEFLETLALATNTDVTISESAIVKGSVYGGSENGFVQTNTNVIVQGSSEIGTNGTSTFGNIYGGGKGLGSTFAAAGRVSGESMVTVSGGTTH